MKYLKVSGSYALDNLLYASFTSKQKLNYFGDFIYATAYLRIVGELYSEKMFDFDILKEIISNGS